MKNHNSKTYLKLSIVMSIMIVVFIDLFIFSETVLKSVKSINILLIVYIVINFILFAVCLFFYFYFRKNEEITKKEIYNKHINKIDIESLPTIVESGFKTGDKIQYIIDGKKCALEIISANKDDDEELSSEEIDEINWLLSSDIINSKQLQNNILYYINKVYKEYEDFFIERISLKDEINLFSIAVSIKKGEMEKVSKIVAFLGDAKCDEEHGISISFKDREFMSIQQETTFDYIS